MPRTCLCIVFNHAFTEHIPLLRKVYAERFSEVRFLVPLKRMPDEPDVITVYRGSYAHNAYMTDALDRLPRDCERYAFIHDDVLVAPALDETNLDRVFGLSGPRDAFMPHVQRTPSDVAEWGHWLGPLWRLVLPRNFLSGTGVESLDAVLRALPPADEALRRMEPYGGALPTTFKVTPTTLDPSRHLAGFRYFTDADVERDTAFKAALLSNLFALDEEGGGRIDVPYPFLVAGPSADVCIVGGEVLDDLAHYCGVLAAAGLFVEIGFPTALALAADRIVTAAMAGLKFEWSMRWLAFGETLDAMADDPVYVAAHPVKLSTVPDKAAMLERLREASSRPVGGDATRALPLPEDFNPEDYLDLNPDVRAAGAGAMEHYLGHGRREGRSYKRAPHNDGLVFRTIDMRSEA